MADSDPEFVARLHPALADLEGWDALAGSDPLVSRAFLGLLESSGSVGEGTGWAPLHIAIERDGRTSAVAPAYLKMHSQGEYVFDHGWADAWHRAGGEYYPKLQVAIPFTPCPGPRLLGEDRQALIAAMETVVRQNQLSSAHATFLNEDDSAAFEARGWLIRHGIQFHWHNRGYQSFDDFLGALSSRKRKTVRRERDRACDGITIETLRGDEIDAEAVEAMWAFYQDTGSRKWGRPYLTRAFFDGMVTALGDRLLMFLARRAGQPVAGVLNIVGDDTLYGRYWGCTQEVPFLHFELSYYRAIDWAIAHGLKSVQAGAQGEHKLARGYEPVLTRSAHFIPHPAFRDAVARYVEGEREATAREIGWARTMLPYRSDSSS